MATVLRNLAAMIFPPYLTLLSAEANLCFKKIRLR
jgi:hypothetical protein